MKKNIVLSIFAGGVFLLSACELENLSPVVDAGTDQHISPPVHSVELKGNAADFDGTIVSYQWIMVSGPAPATLVQPTLPVTRVDNLVEGQYVFQLRATDDDGLSGTDKASVIVYVPGPWDY